MAKEDLDAVRLEIKQLFDSGEFDKAIQKLVALRSSDDPAVRRFAQEFLGVARERKGQPEFARVEYQRFLDEFPDAPEAERVRMRMQALVQATLPHPSAIVSTTDVAKPISPRRDLHGDVNFSYRGSRNTNNDGRSVTSLSLLGTDVNLVGRADGSSTEAGFRISAGHYDDLLPSGKNSTDRFSYLYADVGLKDKFLIRVGRQRAHSRAVLSRFDGVNATYTLDAGPELSLFGGLPVDLSRAALFSDNRRFVGAGIDSGSVWNAFRMGVYGVRQTIEGVLDREAVGVEGAWSGEQLFAQAFADYDVHFRALNALSVNVNRMNTPLGGINFSYNFLKSPFLSTRNALIGQPVDSIQELQNLLSASDELQMLALDRSLDSQTATFGFSKAISTDINISGSVNWFALGQGVASQGVSATPAYHQWYAETRMTINDFLVDGENVTLGVNWSKQDRSEVWSILTSANYRAGGHWRFSPRLRLDLRQNIDGSSQRNYAPALRAEFNFGHSYLFTEAGYLLYRTQFPVLASQKYSIAFAYVGYQYRF